MNRRYFIRDDPHATAFARSVVAQPLGSWKNPPDIRAVSRERVRAKMQEAEPDAIEVERIGDEWRPVSERGYWHGDRFMTGPRPPTSP
jgi:hypothetical protein